MVEFSFSPESTFSSYSGMYFSPIKNVNSNPFSSPQKTQKLSNTCWNQAQFEKKTLDKLLTWVVCLIRIKNAPRSCLFEIKSYTVPYDSIRDLWKQQFLFWFIFSILLSTLESTFETKPHCTNTVKRSCTQFFQRMHFVVCKLQHTLVKSEAAVAVLYTFCGTTMMVN